MKKYKSDALEALHETVSDMYTSGIVDNRTMEEFDNSCLSPLNKLNDICDAILKHHEDGEELLDTLSTIATLMNELGSMRFKGAEYNRVFKHGRLSVDVKFKKEK